MANSDPDMMQALGAVPHLDMSTNATVRQDIRVYRDYGTILLPSVQLDLAGIADLRGVLDEAERDILAYRFRTVDRSGISMFKIRYELSFLGFGEVADMRSVDWLEVSRLLESPGVTGAELRKLIALLTADARDDEADPIEGEGSDVD